MSKLLNQLIGTRVMHNSIVRRNHISHIEGLKLCQSKGARARTFTVTRLLYYKPSLLQLPC